VTNGTGDVPRKIAAEAYDQAIESSDSDGFDIGDVIEECIRELRTQELGDDIIEDYARKLVKAEDDKRARQIENYQGNLFTGEVEALRAPLRLGDGHRVTAGHANRDGILRWLAQRERNAAAVLTSLAAAKEDAARVLPYMTDASVLVVQARELWQLDHPAEP
jgi:hypothetical protein